MELVKKGFKKTEVGVIPEDWKDISLKELIQIRSGESPSKFEMKENGIPYYKVEQLNYTNKYIEFTPFKINLLEPIEKGSIIFPKRGASIFLNKIRILSQDSYMDTNLMTLTSNNSLYNEYLYYQLLFVGLDKVADTTSIPQINNKHILPFKIPLPPTLTEQKAIADALTDVDELINNLEKLIAKKKAIKQGAMQQLLTPPHKGGKRLEGFSGDWISISLGKLANVNMGQSPLSENYNSIGIGLPLIQGNADVSNRKTIVRTFTSQITKRGEIGDIIMSVRAPVGEISRATFQCCLGRGVCSVKYKNDYLYHYLFYFEKSWASFSTGSTFDSVNSKQVNELIIPIPENEQEQIAIARILNDIDFEIEANENKLNKAQVLKQGMMQELLTGKTRLI